VDYKKAGKTNILLQAVDAVNSLAQGQSDTVEMCKKEIKDLEKETYRYFFLNIFRRFSNCFHAD
jgi:hypothetical protein